MKRTIAVVTFALLLGAVLAPVVAVGVAQAKDGPPAPFAPANGDPVDYFTVIVSSLGFNGSAGNLNMTVNQGDTVRITFIYADACPATLKLPGCDDLPFDNPHQIEVGGYQVKSSVIDTANNESTIQFIAGTTGTFEINCILPCEGMANMQNGWLKVVEPGTTSSTTSSSSSIATSSTSSVTTSNSTSSSTSTTTKKIATATALEAPSLNVTEGGLNMSVVLVTSSGSPIAGVPVVFTALTDFGNSTVGKNFTDSNGWAYLHYPVVPTGWAAVFASFAGGSGYNASSVAFQTTALPAPAAPSSVSPYLNLNVKYPDLRLIGVPPSEGEAIVGVFVLALACVYLVIIAVVAQGIRGHWE